MLELEGVVGGPCWGRDHGTSRLDIEGGVGTLGLVAGSRPRLALLGSLGDVRDSLHVEHAGVSLVPNRSEALEEVRPVGRLDIGGELRMSEICMKELTFSPTSERRNAA